MTLEQYGEISNYAAGSALVVLFVAFMVHVAEWYVAHRSHQPAAVAVGAGAPDVVVESDAVDVPSKADRLAGVGISLTVLGTLLIAVATVTRGLAAQRIPLGNMYEFGLSGVTVALVVYIVMVKLSRVQWLAVPALVIVLLVLSLSLSTYVPAGPLVPSLNTFWKYIHVSSVIIAAGFFMVGAAASALYLFKNRAESKGKESGLLARLPLSAKIDRLAFSANAIGFPLWTFGTLITGPIWAHYAWGRYWAWDPKEVWALITWVVYAGYLHARVTAGWKGRRAAWIGLVGFLTFLFSYYIVNILSSEFGINSMHTYAK